MNSSDIRKEFKPKLRRADVFRMGQLVGLTPHTVRRLLEDRRIPPVRYIGCVRAYYDREAALAVMLPVQ